MRNIDSSYDRMAMQEAVAAQRVLDALKDGSTLPYDHPLLGALGDMGWDDIRDKIEEVPGEGWRLRREIHPIRLPDSCYEPRRTLGGGTVRDVMPYEGAVAYVTDGKRFGVQYEDGHVDWLGNDLVSAFGADAAGFYGTDYATYYVTETGRVWLVQSDDDDPATLPREIDTWNWDAEPCNDMVGADWTDLLQGVEL